MDKRTSYGSLFMVENGLDMEDDHMSHEIVDKTENERLKNINRSKSIGVWVFIISMIVTTGFMLSTNNLPVTEFFRPSKPSDTSSDLPSFSFTLRRDGYAPLDSFIGESIEFMKYSILSDHVAVIEPHAAMVFYPMNNLNDNIDSYYYQYKICSSSHPNACSRGKFVPSDSSSNVNVQLGCQVKDTYTIEARKYSSADSSVVAQASGTALCMYVRREIRQLSDEDLDKTMDAMFALYQYSDEEGQKLFGSKYRNSTYLLKIHYFNAAWQDGDHVHEGNGFLPQHLKLTNIFEGAMQAVDPSITLPYWDFTIESAQGIKLWESPIFSSKMFGTLNRATDEYWGWTARSDSIESAAIPDGRWAYLKADRNTMYPDLNYAYGYLRAPWSMNPSPYLSRFTSNNKNLPTCSSHYDLLDHDRLMDFFFMSPYAAHAPTHGSIGGVYGCDLFDPLREQGFIIDEDAQVNLCKNWVFYMKEFFRSNYIIPKQGCEMTSDSMDVSSMDCGFICDSSRTKDFVFALKNILNSDNTCVSADIPNRGWLAWRDFVCDGDGSKIFGGDHLESASAADPSFWPIHPTMERLLHAKYLSGGFLSTRWPTDASQEYVCDKASCYDSEKGFGFWESCCYGHFLDDQYLDPEGGKRDTYTGLTNREIMDASDPTTTSYNMPYIYDRFDWSHCASEGHDFALKLMTLKNQSIERQSLTKEQIDAIVNSKSKIQTSKGGLKDKTNNNVGTNMFDPSFGVDSSKLPDNAIGGQSAGPPENSNNKDMMSKDGKVLPKVPRL